VRLHIDLSGELNGEPLAELAALLDREKPRAIVLELADVTLVTREGVALIRRAVAEGAELVNCPQYIHRWVAEGENEA
jgi:hypothetical protein